MGGEGNIITEGEGESIQEGIDSLVETTNPSDDFIEKEENNQAEIRAILKDRMRSHTRLQEEDFQWRINARPFLTKAAIYILIGQNVAVFYIVFLSFATQTITSLSTILSVLCGATLIETAFLMRTIFKFVFSNIKYQSFENPPAKKPTNPKNKILKEVQKYFHGNPE